jgi:hypothetical protein
VPYKELINLKNIRYQVGLPDKFGDDQGKPRLLTLDDLLNQVYSEAVCDLFTKGRLYQNLLTQNFFHQGAKCRNISLRAKYVVAPKNVRDRNQFSFLAHEVYPENSQSLQSRFRRDQ